MIAADRVTIDPKVRFLDQCARISSGSRSAVVRRAIRLMRAVELGPAYARAWEEWAADGEGAAWDAAAGDGIDG